MRFIKRDMPSVWHAFFVPAGVPDSVKKILADALEKSIKSTDVVKIIRQLGAVEDYKPAGEFKKAMLGEFGMAKALLKPIEGSGK